jgi:RHS repeat-associated protein
MQVPFHPAATLEVYLGEFKSKEGSMKLPRIAVLMACILACFLPVSAIAQNAYVTQSSGHSVSVINTATQSVISTISVGTSPNGVAVSPDGTRVYVALSSSIVSVINTSTNSVVANVTVGNGPFGVAVSPDNSTVYVTNSTDGTVSVINASTNMVTQTVTMPYPFGGGNPQGIAVSPDGGTVYVSVQSSASGGAAAPAIEAISVPGYTITELGVGAIHQESMQMAFAPGGVFLYGAGTPNTGSAAGAVLVFNVLNKTAVTTIPLTNGGIGMVVSPDGLKAYATDGGLIYVIDTNSASVLTTISPGSSSGAVGISLSNDGQWLYATDSLANVRIISTATLATAATLTIGNNPDSIGTFIQPPTNNGGSPSNPTRIGKLLGGPMCPLRCAAADSSQGVNPNGQASVGEPIDLATGNMFYHFTDYSTFGPNPLAFTRSYNSQNHSSGLTTLAATLGFNWRSNFDRYINIQSGYVIAERADGQQLVFTGSGSTWTPDSDVDVTLTTSGTTWTLTDHDDTVETYTTNSAGTAALLNTIQSRNGYTQTLTHNSSSQLTSVTDTYSRSLTLAYNSNGTLASVATPDSTTITFGYTAGGGLNNLTSATYPTSPTSTLAYVYANSMLPNSLTGVTDENGNSYETWTYDGTNRATSSQVGTGSNAQLVSVAYSSANTRVVTNPLGLQDTYTFSTIAGILKVTQISRAATSTTAAATETIAYDANGYLNSLTDWNGNQTTDANNSHGLPTTINEAVGTSVARTTTIAYDSSCVHSPDSITTPGLTTSFTYDGSCEVLTKTQTDTTTQTVPYSTNGQTRTTTFTYSSSLLATVKTPNGNTTTFGHDSTSALTSITDALTHVTNITSHTGGGRPLTIVDPNSVTTTLTYSPRQWLTSSAVSGSGGTFTTTWNYDAAGNMIKQLLPDSSFLAPSYDTAHRVNKVTDALGDHANYTLDALGDITAYTFFDSSGGTYKTHSDSYDALGRLLVDTGGRGQTVTYAYDPNSNNTTVKDGFGHATTNTFDPLNRLGTSTDPNSGVTTMTYDAHDRTTNVKDANGNSTAYVYNGFGDNIQQASPDSGTTVYHYDGDRNLTQKTDALGNVMNAQYDALDRNTSMQYPADTTKDVWKAYDQTGYPHYFGIGRLTSVADAAGCCYSLGYDERGNVYTAQRTIGSGYSTIWQTYDTAGRVSGTTYPSGIFVGYSRDAMGRINEVFVDPAGSTTGQVVAWIGNVPFGPMNYITYGNGVTGPYNLNLDFSIASIQQSTSGGTALQNTSYTLDNNNNVTGVSDAINAANSATLGYDVINRLTSAVSGTGGYGSYSWTLDKVGNRLSQTIGTATTNYTYTSGTNRLSAIGSTSVTTNADGNITSIPPANSGTAATFAYGVDQRLISVTGSPLGATFVNDFMGERFSKQDNGTTATNYTYGTDGALLEENNNGTIIDYIYADGRPIGMFLPVSGGTSGTMYFIHDDRVGQPQFVTNSSQSVVWSTTYQPFGTSGVITASITQNLRLPGQYFDVETGFSQNHFRDYMPNLGRYLETDPIGLRGGLNTYQYVQSQPLTAADRYGLDKGNLTSAGGCLFGGCLGVEVTFPADPDKRNWYFSTGGSFTADGPALGPYSSTVYSDDPDALAEGLSVTSGFGLLDAFEYGASAGGLGAQSGLLPNLSCSYSTRINRDFDYYDSALDQPGNQALFSLLGLDYQGVGPMYNSPQSLETVYPKQPADFVYYNFGPGSRSQWSVFNK